MTAFFYNGDQEEHAKLLENWLGKEYRVKHFQKGVDGISILLLRPGEDFEDLIAPQTIFTCIGGKLDWMTQDRFKEKYSVEIGPKSDQLGNPILRPKFVYKISKRREK